MADRKDDMRSIERARSRATIAFAAAGALALLGCAAPAELGEPYNYAFEQIRTRYVDPVPEEKLQAYSLKGILTGLDPHSDYLDEAQYQTLLNGTRGKYSGVGAMFRDVGHRLTVVAIMEGAPAARAGLQPGDVVTVIDGEPVDAKQISNASLRLKGAPGTTLTLTIAREALAPFDLSMTREVILERSVAARLEPDLIGYIRIAAFLERTEGELQDALYILQRRAGGRLGGLVLDLRGNPGGLFEVALNVAADFLDGGAIVATRGRDPAEDMTYEADPDGDLTAGTPMVVLIDGGSASGAEIVAGALQDRSRAMLVGSRSFGKGSVQTLIPIPGRGALQITTARYYTPSGRSIQARGIEPDLEVAAAVDGSSPPARPRREADLPNALGNPGPIRPAAVVAAPGGRERAADIGAVSAAPGMLADRQLAAAMALLRKPPLQASAVRR
jgi:carboxyl-terminal processing protease